MRCRTGQWDRRGQGYGGEVGCFRSPYLAPSAGNKRSKRPQCLKTPICQHLPHAPTLDDPSLRGSSPGSASPPRGGQCGGDPVPPAASFLPSSVCPDAGAERLSAGHWGAGRGWCTQLHGAHSPGCAVTPLSPQQSEPARVLAPSETPVYHRCTP